MTDSITNKEIEKITKGNLDNRVFYCHYICRKCASEWYKELPECPYCLCKEIDCNNISMEILTLKDAWFYMLVSDRRTSKLWDPPIRKEEFIECEDLQTLFANIKMSTVLVPGTVLVYKDMCFVKYGKNTDEWFPVRRMFMYKKIDLFSLTLNEIKELIKILTTAKSYEHYYTLLKQLI